MLFGGISASPSVFGMVEELMAQRGIVVTSETVRQWCLKFGQTYANELRRRRPRCGDKWQQDARLPDHPWRKTLPLASGGSGWQCARYASRRADANRESSQALLPETPQKTPICPARD